MVKCSKALAIFWTPTTEVLLPWLIIVICITGIVIIAYRFIIRTRSREAYGLIATFVSIGALLGITAGATRTPVIGTFLPALITFITAIMGYLFTREGLTKWRPAIPFCVLGMMMASVVNTFAGSSITERSRDFDRNYEVWLMEKKMEIEVKKEVMLAQVRAGNRVTFAPSEEADPCE
jgi:FtsH-binding integral membrane protein